MTGAEALALTMMLGFIVLVFTGYPIAWILGGLAIVFTALAIIFEVDFAIPTSVDWFYTSMTVDRIWDVMENWVMVALPMFIFMGVLLDRSGIARSLLTGFARLLGPVRGGLAITVTIIGVLLAASTGIIGASVVLLGLLGLPAMLENRYDKHLASGTVCAVGTLGILIPPSIMLVVMADRMAMSVGDLFLGALFPGVLLGGLYIVYLLGVGLVAAGPRAGGAFGTHGPACGLGAVPGGGSRGAPDPRRARQHLLRPGDSDGSGRRRRGRRVAARGVQRER